MQNYKINGNGLTDTNEKKKLKMTDLAQMTTLIHKMETISVL